MWLRDFLQSDLPSCRTMLFGYYPSLKNVAIDTISDYADQLLDELNKARTQVGIQFVDLCFPLI
jgi:hypothetical protein